jgi:hypothetical protein
VHTVPDAERVPHFTCLAGEHVHAPLLGQPALAKHVAGPPLAAWRQDALHSKAKEVPVSRVQKHCAVTPLPISRHPTPGAGPPLAPRPPLAPVPLLAPVGPVPSTVLEHAPAHVHARTARATTTEREPTLVPLTCMKAG